jgi:hypothetical protein
MGTGVDIAATAPQCQPRRPPARGTATGTMVTGTVASASLSPTLWRMPKSEKQTRTTPTDETDESRFSPTHPLLVPDDEDDLAEGESVLTFITHPGSPESQPPSSGP